MRILVQLFQKLAYLSIRLYYANICKNLYCNTHGALKQVDHAHNSSGNFSKSLKVEDSLGHSVSSLRNKNDNKEMSKCSKMPWN